MASFLKDHSFGYIVLVLMCLQTLVEKFHFVQELGQFQVIIVLTSSNEKWYLKYPWSKYNLKFHEANLKYALSSLAKWPMTDGQTPDYIAHSESRSSVGPISLRDGFCCIRT